MADRSDVEISDASEEMSASETPATPMDDDDSDSGFPDPTDPEDNEEETPKDGTSEEDAALDAALAESLLEELSRLKDQGNGHFKKGENQAAIMVYEDAIKAAADGAKKEKVKEVIKPVLISLNSNLAAANLKLEAWEAVVAAASAALELDPANSKALFRRGVARSKLGQLTSAKDDLMAAIRADPKDRNARAELETVQAALKAQRASEKASFAEKFGSATEKAVAKEEAKEAARKKEEARLKAVAEEALKAEWRIECVRLKEQQKQERELARQARLKRFMGEDAAVPAPDAAAAGGSGGGGDAKVKDLTQWAKDQLRSRLGQIEVEAEGARVDLEVGIAKLRGGASVAEVETDEGVILVHDFDFGFEVPFTVETRAEPPPGATAPPPKVVGGGTLTYTGVSPMSLGGSDTSVDVGADGPAQELNPESDEDTDEVKAEKQAQVSACVAQLKQKIAAALDKFGAAIELKRGGEPGDAEDEPQALSAFAAAGALGGIASAAASAFDAVGGGSSSAPAAASGDEPISFADFKKNKEKKEKEEKERREAAEKAAKDAQAEERRRARKAEKIELKNDDDLKGISKGYKLRADGSKTSYFDRQLDPETKALLDAQKAPKRLSAGPSDLSGGEGAVDKAGSAWNTGGTWEEKDMSKWAKEQVEESLKLTSSLEGGVKATVTKVKDLEGTASVVATRGALRHLYEFKFNLEFKLSTEATSAGGEGEGGEEEGGEEEGAASAKVPKVTSSTVCKGTLEYHDVMPAKEGGVVDIGNVAQSFKSQPKDKPPAVAAVEALKRAVLQTLADFDADFRASKKV